MTLNNYTFLQLCQMLICTCIFCNIEDVGDFRNYVYNIWFYIWSHSCYN